MKYQRPEKSIKEAKKKTTKIHKVKHQDSGIWTGQTKYQATSIYLFI